MDGVNLQDWLQATGTFVGSACKKYPHQMGVHIILQVIFSPQLPKDALPTLGSDNACLSTLPRVRLRQILCSKREVGLLWK